MSANLDCLPFVSDALEAQGALVEPATDSAFVVCPEDLASELAIPTEFECDREGERSGRLSIGFGSPLLERLVEKERERVHHVCGVLDVPPVRASQAKSLAERFVVRNGLADLIEITPATAVYSLLWLSWSAECDERYDGLVQVTLDETDFAEPAASWLAASDSVVWRVALSSQQPAPPADALRLARIAAQRARSTLDPALANIRSNLQRRKERDHARIVSYFSDLARDAGRVRGRARADAEALSTKLDHFSRERDAKLADLDVRFALRVILRPVALLRLQVPVARARLRLRRRKEARELFLRLPAEACRFDRPSCEACEQPLDHPAVCDTALHLLCNACAPEARGRLSCPACSRLSDPRT